MLRRLTTGACALALAGAAGAAPPPDPGPEILILAGSASKPVLEQAAPLIESELGLRLAIDFGGSGGMLSRLELARRGDIYLPGSHDYLERAANRGVIDPGTRVDFAYLVPAILVRAGNPLGVQRLGDLARPGVRAAIAEPRTVCVGEYAVDVLRRAGLEGSLGPHLGRARSCAALAGLLALGNVDAILGWRVFASWYPDRLEVVPLPSQLVTRVASVPGAVTTFAAHPEAAARVLAWLAGPRGRAIWQAHGYIVDPARLRALAPQASLPR